MADCGCRPLERKAVLTVHRTRAEFGVPLSTRTVELELYLKVSRLPHEVVTEAYPTSPMAGPLPFVRFGRDVAAAPESVRYLQQVRHCSVALSSPRALR
jgi:hypothetical protein